MRSAKMKLAARLAGVSLGVLAMQAAPALAQNALEGEDIVVTGVRLSNQRAIDSKRDASTITDVIASDEMDKLPDQNLAEALARAPGVSTFQDEGAGLYVAIRGLSQEFVNLTMDGLEVSTAARTFDTSLRGANLEAVPSSFLSEVQVIKSVTPDLDGDAIAGTVNLVTRSAIDNGKPWLTVGASGGYYEKDVPSEDADPSFKGKASFGQRFADGTIGLVLDAHFREISRDNLKPYAFYGAASDMSELPLESGGFFYQRGESSWGASGKLEFRPSDMVQGYISAVYFDSDIGINKNKHALYGASSDGDSGTFWGGVGTARNDDIRYGVDDSLALTGALDFQLDDRNRVSLNGRTSSSTSYQDFGRVDWYYGGPLSGSYTFNGTYYDVTFDEPSDANWIDTGNYAFNGYRRYHEELEKTVNTAKLDWVNASSDGQGLGFASGFKFKQTDLDYTAEYGRWRKPVDSYDWGQYLYNADYTFPGVSSSQVIMADIASLRNYAEGLGASGFSRISAYSNGNDYTVSEQVLAGYALLDYAGPDIRLIGGLRYEATDTKADNRFNYTDDADFVRTDASYDNWLPSVALTWFAQDDLLLRAGVSRTIGRPDPRDLARGETPPNDNGYYERGNPDLKPRLSTNIDASLEYYFGGGDNLLSVALFYKEIENEIFDLQTPYTFINDLDEPMDSFFIQPTNGGNAHVEGVEVGLVLNKLDFLPGPLANLGLSANATFTDGELEVLAEDGSVARRVKPESMSDVLANASLFYEDGDFSARLAWRYTGPQTQSLSVDGTADLLLEDYQQTDLQLSYRVSDNLELFGEVWNLFENKQEFAETNMVDSIPNWFEYVDYGRAIWLGVNFKH